MACQLSSTITIYRRSKMTKIFERQFDSDVFYFEQLKLLSHNEGRQTYIFYSMSSNMAHRVGMFEVLIDEAKTDAE